MSEPLLAALEEASIAREAARRRRQLHREWALIAFALATVAVVLALIGGLITLLAWMFQEVAATVAVDLLTALHTPVAAGIYLPF